ncbi:MAG: roadblock/LC7 domain-containing protein [Myxococcales bacterium]|nr:roadblock/LC7 domain-containing protein [Myxococcales bacterium]
MANQLVMYEEELTLINTICAALQRDSNSKAVFVIDKNGQEISHAGDVEELDVTSLSSLTAGNVAATGGIAQLLAEKEFTGQLHEGEQTSIRISIIGQRVILLIVFDQRTSPGLVRLREKKASKEIELVLEQLVKKSAANSQPSVFAEITDADIDNLFSE